MRSPTRPRCRGIGRARIALLRAGTALDGLPPRTSRSNAASTRAPRIGAPLRQIIRNAGAEAAPILELVRSGEANWGYNLATESYGDMFAWASSTDKVHRLACSSSSCQPDPDHRLRDRESCAAGGRDPTWAVAAADSGSRTCGAWRGRRFAIARRQDTVAVHLLHGRARKPAADLPASRAA